MKPIETYRSNQNLLDSTDKLRAKLHAEEQANFENSDTNPIRGVFFACVVGAFLWYLGWKVAEWLLLK